MALATSCNLFQKEGVITTTAKKPAQLAREKLAKRAADHISLVNKIVPKSMQKSPSQRKSEAGRKKYLKRAGKQAPDTPPMEDCRDCPKKKPATGLPCGKLLEHCEERSLVLRCKKCGQRVRFRVINGVAWELCPVCRSV